MIISGGIYITHHSPLTTHYSPLNTLYTIYLLHTYYIHTIIYILLYTYNIHTTYILYTYIYYIKNHYKYIPSYLHYYTFIPSYFIIIIIIMRKMYGVSFSDIIIIYNMYVGYFLHKQNLCMMDVCK